VENRVKKKFCQSDYPPGYTKVIFQPTYVKSLLTNRENHLLTFVHGFVSGWGNVRRRHVLHILNWLCEKYNSCKTPL